MVPPAAAPFMTSALSTAGGLVFIGSLDRSFKAVDTVTGKVLWETRLGTSVQGFPISYSIDGRQYIAVPTASGAGAMQMFPELLIDGGFRTPSSSGSAIYAFALPDKQSSEGRLGVSQDYSVETSEPVPGTPGLSPCQPTITTYLELILETLRNHRQLVDGRGRLLRTFTNRLAALASSAPEPTTYSAFLSGPAKATLITPRGVGIRPRSSPVLSKTCTPGLEVTIHAPPNRPRCRRRCPSPASRNRGGSSIPGPFTSNATMCWPPLVT